MVEYGQIGSGMVEYGQIGSGMVEYGQIGSDMVEYGQIGSGMVKFGRRPGKAPRGRLRVLSGVKAPASFGGSDVRPFI
jgi:hypothetical protein